MKKKYNVGDKIKIIDDITYEMVNCTIVLIEEDEIYAGLVWYYLKSEYSDDNTNFEPKLGYNIYKLISSDSEFILNSEEE